MIDFPPLSWDMAKVAGIIFASQLAFIYLRTVNVSFISRNNKTGAIMSGFGVGMLWLITTTLGVASMMDYNYLAVVAHLSGGAIGTYVGMIKKQRNV